MEKVPDLEIIAFQISTVHYFYIINNTTCIHMDICTFQYDPLVFMWTCWQILRSLDAPFVEGVAFPTCVSVNEIVGHFSPLPVDISAQFPGHESLNFMCFPCFLQWKSDTCQQSRAF